jgi:hypothetical protein
MTKKTIKYYIIKSLRIRLDSPEQTNKEVKKIITDVESKFDLYCRFNNYTNLFDNQKDRIKWLLGILCTSIKTMSAEDTGAKYFFVCDSVYGYGLKSSGRTIKDIVRLTKSILDEPTVSPENKLPVSDGSEETMLYSLSILLKQVITRDFKVSTEFIKK